MTEQEGVNWKWLNEEKLYKVYRDGRVFSYIGNKFLNANYNKARKTYLMHIRINNKNTIMGVYTIVYPLNGYWCFNTGLLCKPLLQQR